MEYDTESFGPLTDVLMSGMASKLTKITVSRFLNVDLPQLSVIIESGALPALRVHLDCYLTDGSTRSSLPSPNPDVISVSNDDDPHQHDQIDILINTYTGVCLLIMLDYPCRPFCLSLPLPPLQEVVAGAASVAVVGGGGGRRSGGSLCFILSELAL